MNGEPNTHTHTHNSTRSEDKTNGESPDTDHVRTRPRVNSLDTDHVKTGPDRNVVVIEIEEGELQLSRAELDALSLPPKFQVYEQLTSDLFEIELAMFATKYRWEMSKRI